LAKFAGLDIKFQRSIANTLDLFDVKADLFEHPTDLSVPPFDESDLVPRIFLFADKIDFSGSSLYGKGSALNSRLFLATFSGESRLGRQIDAST
jgi:hypothetical protein